MLKCLQVGRAFAALAVVAFHLSTAFGDPRYGGRPIGQAWTLHGNLGVDFFFVLSGFIILSAHLKDLGQPSRWTTYLWRRFARVYPIYWIYLAIFCLLLALGAGEVAHLPTSLAAWVSAFSLLRFSPDTPPLQVAWTLFHEVAFYAIFSLVILNRWVGITALALWAFTCAVTYHYTGESGDSAWRVYTSAFNLEFFFGMGAFALYRRGRDPWLLIAGGAVIVALACALLIASGRVEHDLFGLGFALAIAGFTIAESTGRLPSSSAFVALGGASYTLYLIHVPIMGVVLKMVRLSKLTSVAPSVVTWWLVYATTVVVAYLAWIVLEKPLQLALRFGPPSATLAAATKFSPGPDRS
jgi:peptidoglycan/LPS O-acetylase OafA/YrhL